MPCEVVSFRAETRRRSWWPSRRRPWRPAAVGLVLLPERGGEEQLARPAGGFARRVDGPAGAQLDLSLAVTALAGSIARHSNRIVRSGSPVLSVGEPVADVDPQLVGRWKVRERSLGEGLEGPGAAGVGSSAGEGLGVEVDGPGERDAVPGGDTGADGEVGVVRRRR